MESKAGYIFRNGRENHFERKSKHKSNKQVVPCNNRPTLRSDKNILKPCTYAKGIVQTSDNNVMKVKTAAARLAHLGERRSAEREAVGSNPCRTNTQGL